jgi:hypothetical protein
MHYLSANDVWMDGKYAFVGDYERSQARQVAQYSHIARIGIPINRQLARLDAGEPRSKLDEGGPNNVVPSLNFLHIFPDCLIQVLTCRCQTKWPVRKIYKIREKNSTNHLMVFKDTNKLIAL